jgi:hypothetical protein
MQFPASSTWDCRGIRRRRAVPAIRESIGDQAKKEISRSERAGC